MSHQPDTLLWWNDWLGRWWLILHTLNYSAMLFDTFSQKILTDKLMSHGLCKWSVRQTENRLNWQVQMAVISGTKSSLTVATVSRLTNCQIKHGVLLLSLKDTWLLPHNVRLCKPCILEVIIIYRIDLYMFSKSQTKHK